MTSLESGFEADLREAVMDDVERRMVGERDGIVFQFVQQCHDILRAYGDRHGYDVEPVIDSLAQPSVTRRRGVLTVKVGWDHEAAPFFQMGTSDHTISGNPVLSFVWEDPPTWVRQEFDQARESSGRFAVGWRVFFSEVDVEGLPESRFVRDAIQWLRQELST